MTISQIQPEDSNSWDNKCFVELDIDWAPDEVIEDTFSLLDQYNVSATIFSTHRSAAIDNVLGNEIHEVGIHPNFIPLLKGNRSNGVDFKDVVCRLMELVPDAKSVKAHSLVDSSAMLEFYASLGITHDNSYLIDAPSMHPLKPWRLWNRLIRVPLYWEDDYACVTPYQRDFDEHLQRRGGVKIFGFHPLHIFLNTESLDRYGIVRSFQDDPKRLLDYRFDGIGTRTRFVRLLEFISGTRNVL